MDHNLSPQKGQLLDRGKFGEAANFPTNKLSSKGVPSVQYQ